jgi:transposase-like protein
VKRKRDRLEETEARSEAEWAMAERRRWAQRKEPPGVEERTEGVLLLLAGRSSVEQLALRFGVHAETVECWRSQALQGIETALCTGPVHFARERMLARAREALEKAVLRLAIQHELAQRELCERPAAAGRRRP